jgi:hypothetical protein
MWRKEEQRQFCRRFNREKTIGFVVEWNGEDFCKMRRRRRRRINFERGYEFGAILSSNSWFGCFWHIWNLQFSKLAPLPHQPVAIRPNCVPAPFFNNFLLFLPMNFSMANMKFFLFRPLRSWGANVAVTAWAE